MARLCASARLKAIKSWPPPSHRGNWQRKCSASHDRLGLQHPCPTCLCRTPSQRENRRDSSNRSNGGSSQSHRVLGRRASKATDRLEWIMALFFRFLLGIPMFAALCAISALGISLAVQPGTVSLRVEGLCLAALFAAQAFAIWRILLFRRADAARPQPALGGGTGGGSPGSRPPDAGKPSPLTPSPTHHLSAAEELPPSDKAQSFPHD